MANVCQESIRRPSVGAVTTVRRWTLSGFGDEISPDPATQLSVLSALGARQIEVRAAWNQNIVELGSELLGALGSAITRVGFGVSAIASPVGKSDISEPADYEFDRLKRAITAAHVLGTTRIRIFSYYRAPGLAPADIRDAVLARLASLAALAAREGVVLLHENEKGIYGDVPERVLDIVESVGSESLRLAWDSANFVQVGVRPFSEAWPLLADHVDYVQIKDADAATGAVRPAGLGDGELLETLTALRDRGYEGVLSLEPHLGSVGPIGAFSGPRAFGEAARALHRLLDRIGVETA